jgi:hypothetical protein
MIQLEYLNHKMIKKKIKILIQIFLSLIINNLKMIY